MAFKPSPTFLRVLLLLAMLSLAPVAMFIMYTRTGGPASGKEVTFQHNLRFALMSGNEAVDLAPLTDWPWVKVCAIDSGVGEKALNTLIGFDYKDFGELHWLPLKDYWTLLFIDEPRTVSWGTAQLVVPVRISRKELADLALPEGAKGQCIDRGSGRIEVTRKPAPVGTTPVTLHLVDSENN
jgi:hypothetical protein